MIVCIIKIYIYIYIYIYIEKGAFGLPSTMVANFTFYLYIYIN